MEHTATYSPEDDKIRIYPAYRLPTDEYQILKAAGYGWAPKQECFYAVWSPSREAIALDFAEEIEDEDKSLVERAEERADRFETYSDNRAADASRAHAAVKAIADNIPFGQPILVGHHSERHARRDAKRIEQGMRRAVDAWETSEYWTRRAAGALAHAKYKERPDVRARRIKTIEADKRKREKQQKECETALKFWQRDDLTKELAIKFTGYTNLDRGGVKLANGEDRWSAYSALTNGKITVEDVRAQRLESLPGSIAYYQQWLDHYSNRLAYERAMLAEGGGRAADGIDFQVGGQVRHKWGWNIIKRLNKKDGRVVSLSLINNQWPTVVQVEDVKEYKAPAESDMEKVQAATKNPPLCNYQTEGCATMTQAEYTKQYKDYKGSMVVTATDRHGAHRLRTIDNFLARKHGATAATSQWGRTHVFISDAKVTEAPKLKATAPVELPATERPAPRATYQAPEPKPEAADFQAMKQSLKTGIQTVTAPQLFPTPPDIARQMVELAEIQPGMTVLEPSAGTGNILQEIINDDKAGAVVAVEINQTLCDHLKTEYPLTNVHCFDFLTYDRSKWPVDRIIMNPPFENGADIKHIQHAITMLKPGGRLVALCANGPRQQAALQPVADHWEALPAGSFASQGTAVNVALMIYARPTLEPQP